jgi:hypothetical protein
MKNQGHLSGHMTPQNIADKHKVSLDNIKSELKKGIKVEKEHTNDVKQATRIALDHLLEDPKYYTKLSSLGLEENQSLPLNKDLVKEFIKHVMSELKLENLPTINLSDDSQEAVDMHSWGGYQPTDKSISIVIAKRHPADIFRTLAHELVHYKQDLTGRLQPGDGKTGSDVENEANSRAAIIMRNFAQAQPNLFEHLITEVGDGIKNIFDFRYIGGPYKEYIFKTDTNEYKVAFKEEAENSYERVYHTTNRRLGHSFDDTQEGKPLKINATVMAITLDFIKRNPNIVFISINPLDSRRFNLVKKFIENNLPKGFEVKYHRDQDNIMLFNRINFDKR